ncbi:MAG TPA: AAA domain-containing protein, partial [Candidatus Hydrogenedentes bacterium]|nr:AAA domain-containing protein [Candidatus Hydrogenedentota bacterium]
EGHTVYWETGVGTVLAMDASVNQLHVRDITGALPSRGATISIRPPDFVSRLLEVWAPEENYRQFESLYEKLSERGAGLAKTIPDLQSLFPACNVQQGRCSSLTHFSPAFLWGPPGTGKTSSLGRLIAALLARTDLRVLMVSNTNVAVDLCMIAAVRGLREIGRGDIVQKCLRLGTRADPAMYTDNKCEAVVEPDAVRKGILKRLSNHMEKEPDDSSPLEERDAWVKEEENLRQQLQARAVELLRCKRFAALTFSRGFFEYEAVKSAAFDQLVVDEAGQVGQAAVLPFLPLTKGWLFAGDHQQLAPIVQTQSAEAEEWLGTSLLERFADESEPNTILLEEQYRMSEPICASVSKHFYGGRLRVADALRTDTAWQKRRDFRPCRNLGRGAMVCLDIESEAEGHHEYGKGYIRKESAMRCVEAVMTLLGPTHNVGPEEIAVITVYRAQRRLIWKMLLEFAKGQPGLTKDLLVSTVHALQGGERPHIIFDPVAGNGRFVVDQLGPRIVNVALSRTMTRFICTLSQSDIENPILRAIGKDCARP